ELGDGRDRARPRNRGLDPHAPPRGRGAGDRIELACDPGRADHGRGRLSAQRRPRVRGRHPDRGRRRRLRGSGAPPPCAEPRRDRVGPACAGDGTLMPPTPLYLKPRGATDLVAWEEIAVDAPEVTPQTALADAQFVALDVETTGNAPFLVLEIGAERFSLAGTLSFFDTLVDCRAPINPYARKRHHIDRSMLIGAPEFKDARRGFLRFAQAAVLVEHSHDAFDTWLVGRGLESPLEHPIIDTTALARLVL